MIPFLAGLMISLGAQLASDYTRPVLGAVPAVALARLAALDETPPPPVPRVDITVDLFSIVDGIQGASKKGHTHEARTILGLVDLVRQIVQEVPFVSTDRAATIVSQITFAGQSAAIFNAGEKLRLKLPFRGAPGPNDYWGIGLGTPSGDYAAIMMTSPAFTAEGKNQIKGLHDNVLGIYLPGSVPLEVAQGTSPVPLIRAHIPEGVTIGGDLTVKGKLRGAKSVLALDWTLPASALRAGNGNAAGARIVPFPGKALMVEVECLGPDLPPGTLTLDLNVKGKSMWATTPDVRPTLTTSRPAGLFDTSPFKVPVYPEVAKGDVITVDVDTAPASIPVGTTVRITAWLVVELP